MVHYTLNNEEDVLYTIVTIQVLVNSSFFFSFKAPLRHGVASLFCNALTRQIPEESFTVSIYVFGCDFVAI